MFWWVVREVGRCDRVCPRSRGQHLLRFRRAPERGGAGTARWFRGRQRGGPDQRCVPTAERHVQPQGRDKAKRDHVRQKRPHMERPTFGSIPRCMPHSLDRAVAGDTQHRSAGRDGAAQDVVPSPVAASAANFHGHRTCFAFQPECCDGRALACSASACRVQCRGARGCTALHAQPRRRFRPVHCLRDQRADPDNPRCRSSWCNAHAEPPLHRGASGPQAGSLQEWRTLRDYRPRQWRVSH
mmetsp:Transcript_68619/g.188167  ORF Transcript_68619/g.188167 Transcript_68619/m.188167 type:complete len:241 (+) Transcript_68619:2313-3035(+)